MGELLGCGQRLPSLPSNPGLTRFSTAYTLNEDPAPDARVTSLLVPAEGSDQSIFVSDSDLRSLQDPDSSRVIESLTLGNYYVTKHTGGASILTPRHALLTDHQILWQDTRDQGSIYLNDACPHLNSAHVLVSKKTIIGGWTLLELDQPLIAPQSIRVANNPNQFLGYECLIPIPKETFRLHNKDALPSNLIREREGILFVRGRVLQHPEQQFTGMVDPAAFDGNNFVIQINDDLDLHGASGFPVLVYNHTSNEWVMLAIVISSTYDKSHQLGKLWVHASAIDQELLENIGAELD